jgi:two-component system, chemotaxis family, protein-glutamate methylesterase/glutaminase
VTAPAPGYRLVVIGVSAGGLFALRTLMAGLPADFDIPIAVVQHRSKDSELLCELLQECAPLVVGEANDKEPILPGHVYVGPPDYHLLVERGYFVLSTDEPVRFSRPSVDVMFLSAADAYSPDVVGVVLTGANADGSRGLRRIADRGGLAVVQDPESSESPAMPAAALRCVPDAEVLPMPDLARFVAALTAPKTAPARGDR